MNVIKDIPYGHTPHPDRVLDMYLPEEKSFPVFIYFHGGGLEFGDKIDGELLASYMVPRGVALISANYRMYPEAVYPEFFMDAAACVAWVKNHISEYGDCTGIYVGGSSAGGNISMMLCYDKRFLAPYRIDPLDIKGYVQDAGQPTVHYNILRERGIDQKKIIVDDSCALYHVGEAEKLSHQLFIYSDNDMENRPEQTVLMLSTLKHYRYDPEKIRVTMMHGTHCEYVGKKDENGDSILGKMIYEFVSDVERIEAEN